MQYYARIEQDGDIYRVSFPDLPNVITYGESPEQARQYAAEALSGTVEADFERGFSIPEPREYTGPDYVPVTLEPHIGVAITLRTIRGERSQKEIAEALGISPQAYQRLENPRRSNPTLKTLERIAEVFGRRLEVQLR